MGPGGLFDDNTVLGNCTGGAAGYIDKLILSENHIYSNPTPKEVYHTDPFDPEGILGMETISLIIHKPLIIIKHIFRKPHNDLPSVFGISSWTDNCFVFGRQAEDREDVDLERSHRGYRDWTVWGIQK